jgi:hypothetical protein
VAQETAARPAAASDSAASKAGASTAGAAAVEVPAQRPLSAEEQAAARAAQEAALAAAERAAGGDVFVAEPVELAPGWTWTEKYSSNVEMDLAIGGRQQLGLRVEDDQRKIEVTEVTEGRVTGARVTYAKFLYRMDFNGTPGDDEHTLEGKTYQVSYQNKELQLRGVNGVALSRGEQESLRRREATFGRGDPFSASLKGRRFPRDFEVEMPPADFASPMGQFKIAPVRVVVIYRGKEKGGARFELRSTMLGDNDAMKVRVENEETILVDRTGWRLTTDQTAQLRTDGSIVGRGTTKVHRESTSRTPPKHGK